MINCNAYGYNNNYIMNDKHLKYKCLFNILCTSQGFYYQVITIYFVYVHCTVSTVFKIHRHSYS